MISAVGAQAVSAVLQALCRDTVYEERFQHDNAGIGHFLVIQQFAGSQERRARSDMVIALPDRVAVIRYAVHGTSGLKIGLNITVDMIDVCGQCGHRASYQRERQIVPGEYPPGPAGDVGKEVLAVISQGRGVFSNGFETNFRGGWP